MCNPSVNIVDDYDRLYERVFHDSSGENPLSAEEIAKLFEEVQRTKDTGLLDLVGYAVRHSYDPYRSIVDSFLEGPNPLLAGIAIWIISKYWGLTSQYIEQITRLIRGVSWDSSGDAQMWAMSAVQDYLKHTPEPRILREIVWVAERKDLDNEQRRDAVHTLYHIFGYPKIDEAHLLKRAKERFLKENI